MDKIDTRIFHLEAFIRSMNIDISALYNEYHGRPPRKELEKLLIKVRDWKYELKQLKITRTRLNKIKKITGDEY